MHILKVIIFVAIFQPIILLGQKQVLDKIVGVVGNNLILKSDIETQFLQQNKGMSYTGSDLKCDIFEDLLYQNLLVHHAQIDSLEVTDKEVEDQLERRIKYFVQQIGSETKLEEYFGKTITEIKEDLRSNLKNQLYAEKMEAKITDGLKVTPSEVRQYFKNIPKDSIPYIEEELEYEQIVLYPTIPEELKLLAKEKLNELRERAIKENNFSTLAALYSEDPGSAAKGGELGFVGRSDLVPEFSAVAFNVKEGEVSRIIETEFGYHIIQLIERRGELINVRHILITTKVPATESVACRKRLDSIASVIRIDTLTFDKAADKYSNDVETKHNGGLVINPMTGNSRFHIDQVDPVSAIHIKRLKVGELSSPFEFTDNQGKKAYKIIRLKSKIPAHFANLNEDYQRIQEASLNLKRQETVAKWVRNKVRITYIQVDDSYKNCTFRFPNWVKQN